MKSPSPSPAKLDGRRVRGDRSRDRVLECAVRIAADVGLEGLTLGTLADAARLPKSTLQVLFKDRQSLQEAVLRAGAEMFAAAMRAKVPPALQGLARLRALCEAWFDVVSAPEALGGCLVTACAAEFRRREGIIKSSVAELREQWRAALRASAHAAQEGGELRGDTDIEQLVFEILALQSTANLLAGHADHPDFERARVAVKSLLGAAQSVRPPGRNPTHG